MTTLNEYTWLYNNSYGKATRISKKTLIRVLVIVCMITPCTNWLIPILPKIIRSGIVWRYNNE